MTTVSVALATFNGARFLHAQLASLAAQELLPSEVIVNDDGSTDATPDIVHAFSRSAPFPVHLVVNDTRLGYAANFLACAERCSGDLIAFCDQDDVWHPRKLATQASSLETNGALLSTHGSALVDERGAEIGAYRPAFPLRSRMSLSDTNPWAFMPGFTLVFRRELLRFNRYWSDSIDLYRPDSTTGHDLWFFFLSLCFGTIVSEPQPLALYRQHGRNTSGSRIAHRSAIPLKIDPDRRVTEYGLMAKVANNRARILTDISRDPDFVSDRDAAIPAAVLYAAAAERCARRQRVYASQSMFEGMRHIGESLTRGDYALHDTARFSTRGAARDLLAVLTRHAPTVRRR